MIAITKQTRQSTQVQDDEQFLQMMPAIKRYARLTFRTLPPHEREEATSEVVCSAFCAFRRLAALGKQHLAFATPLARFAVAHFRAGRRVGNKLNSNDVTSVVNQRQHGFTLQSLRSGLSEEGVWIEILADNKLTPVPDQVVFRIDFPAWFRLQNQRDRKLAKFLALGNSATEAARHFGVSEARVSQLRSKLRSSWQEFQREAT